MVSSNRRVGGYRPLRSVVRTTLDTLPVGIIVSFDTPTEYDLLFLRRFEHRRAWQTIDNGEKPTAAVPALEICVDHTLPALWKSVATSGESAEERCLAFQ